MLDLHYRNKALVDIYDADDSWSEDRLFYLGLAGDEPIDILDIGCGTGRLANAYAEKGHRVTGLDPAQAMLAIARGKPQGTRIRWIEGDARNFKLEDQYDLIIMTGHAFQVLLSDEEIKLLFRCVRNHLKPEGRFIFESRNPAIDWPKRWHHRYTIETHKGPVTIQRQSGPMIANKVSFSAHFEFGEEKLASKSTLYFPEAETIRSCAKSADIKVKALYGDWDWASFDSARHEDMIFVLTL